jgi:DMSO reductase family type II enzyme heme b subunit
MPAWRGLPEKERRAVVAYVKSLADAYRQAKIEPAALAKEVGSSEASIRRGRKMFEAFECNKCHGQAGRGDPAPGSDLKDDWGTPIRPANLHKPWTFRGGASRKDVVMRLSAGVAGTPMPSIADAIDDYRKSDEKDPDVREASIWDLANYVRSLGPDRPNWAALLQVQAATDEVPSDPNAEFWRKLLGANFPLVGQVVVDPRNFNPTVDMVTVRAVHTRDEIVLHLTWDDPTPSDPAKGAPKPDMLAVQLARVDRDANWERPYFLMGERGKPVTLLTWRSGTGVGEAVAEGVGRLAPRTGEAVETKGEVAYEAGQYRLVIRRPQRSKDPKGFGFPATEFFAVGFWAWDGGEGEEGTKAAMSTWYYGKLEAPPSPRPFVIPPIAALGMVLVELGVVRWARGRREAGR